MSFRFTLATIIMICATMGTHGQEVRVPGGELKPIPLRRANVYGGPMQFELTGTCSAEVLPTKAVVVGGSRRAE